MITIKAALLAGAVVLAPLALPTASQAVPAPGPVALPDTTWRTFTSLMGSDVGATLGSEFGYSVASDGNTLVVGARYQGSNGAAYIYTRDSGTETWTFRQKLDAPATAVAPGNGARFGQAVAVSGDTIAVGAPYEPRNYNSLDWPSAGAVYVYTGSGGSWSGTPQRLVDPDTGLLNDARFGAAIAVDATTMAIGAPGKYRDALTNKFGAIGVFTRSGATWGSGVLLLDANGAQYRMLGTSVAISGNTILGGAPGDTSPPGNELAGKVVTFTGNGTSWVQGADVTRPAGLLTNAMFGWAVQANATNVVIAAPTSQQFLNFPDYPKLFQYGPGGAGSAIATNTATNPGPYGAFTGDSLALDSAERIYVGRSGQSLEPVRVDVWGPPHPLTTTRNTAVSVAAPGVLVNDGLPTFMYTGFSLATVSLVTGASNGVASLNADGSFTYTPNPNFVGTDAFTYRVDALNQTASTASATEEPIPAVDSAPIPSEPTTVTIVVSPTYDLVYLAGPGGTVSGTTTQVVNPGASGTTVTAVPDAGYRFVRWSDGVTTASRTDSNVTGNISVTAQFEQITYTLTYSAGPHGSVSGTSPQTVVWGGSGTAVTAVPAQGARFVAWSDGVSTATRVDSNVKANLSATAQFEQLPLDVKATAVKGRTQFKLQVITPCQSQYQFTIEKRHKKTTQQGSDEPVVTITWKKLKGTYTTKGEGHTKTVNLPKGIYRAVVAGNCGYLGVTSNEVTLKK